MRKATGILYVFVALFVSLWCHVGEADLRDVRTVALSGIQMPGLADSFADVGYFGVSLNDLGETSFVATPTFHDYEYVFRADPVNAIHDESAWTEAGGHGLRRIAHETFQFPNTGPLESVMRPMISNGAGTISNASHSGQTTTSRYWAEGILREQQPSGISALAARGQPAATGELFEGMVSPSVNLNGDLAFHAGLGMNIHRYYIGLARN